jgi:hypothetical protein
MFPRPSSTIRQIGYSIFISFFLFIFIVLISFESSKDLKCSTCSILNFSSTTPKTFYQVLNNKEDERTSVNDYSIWCLDMAHRLDSEQRLPQSPILRAPLLNSARLNRLPYLYSQWKFSPLLPRRLTPCEHNLVMRLLMIIERICRKHNITFMLSDGSLLGSWRHHDIIPWDDDIDIMIPIEEKTRFIGIIQGMNETLMQYHVLSSSRRKREYYKIFFKNTPSAGSYSWNFPFVDIFLYVKNDTHLWQMADPDTITKVKYIFPLVMRPFGELWLPAARKPKRIFKFDAYDYCKGHFWNHKNETRQHKIVLKCNDLKHIYPFVERTNQRTSMEILRTNDTIIHTVIYG